MVNVHTMAALNFTSILFLETAEIVSVARAQPTSPAQVIPDVAILIGGLGEFPSSRSEEEYRGQPARFEQDARAIAQALTSALPGGTLDRLVIALLEHKSSRMIVSCVSCDPRDPDRGERG